MAIGGTRKSDTKPGGGRANSAFLSPDLEEAQRVIEAELSANSARGETTGGGKKSNKKETKAKTQKPNKGQKISKAEAKRTRKLIERITEGTSYNKDMKPLTHAQQEVLTARYFEQFYSVVGAKAERMAQHSGRDSMTKEFFIDMIIEGVLSRTWTYNHLSGMLYKNRDGKETKNKGKNKTNDRHAGRGSHKGGRMHGGEYDEYGESFGFGGAFHGMGGGTHTSSASTRTAGYIAGETKWDSTLRRYVPINEVVEYPFCEFEPRFPRWEVDMPSIAGGYYFLGNIPEGVKLEQLYKMRNHPALFFTPAVFGELSFLAKEIKTEWAVMLMYTRLSDESAHWLCTDYIIAGQVVSGATVDFDNADLQKYYAWLKENHPNRYPNDAALHNQLGHLHSHVGMATGFSGTDIQTQENLGQLAFSSDLRFFAVINNREELNLAALIYRPLYYRMDKVPWGICISDPRYNVVTDERKEWLKATCEKLVMKSEAEARRKYGVVSSKIKDEPAAPTTIQPTSYGYSNVNRRTHKTYLASDHDCMACTRQTCKKENTQTGYTYCPKDNVRNLWQPGAATPATTTPATTTTTGQGTNYIPESALSNMDAKFDNAKFGMPSTCPTCKRAISAWTYQRFGVFACPYCGGEYTPSGTPDGGSRGNTSDTKEDDRTTGEAGVATAGNTQTTTSSTPPATTYVANAGQRQMMSESSVVKVRTLDLAVNAAQGAVPHSAIEDSTLGVCGIATNGAVPALWGCADKKYPLDPEHIKQLTDATTELMVAGEAGNLWNFWTQIQNLYPNFPKMGDALKVAEEMNIHPYLYLYLSSKYPGEDFSSKDILAQHIQKLADVNSDEHYEYYSVYLEAIIAVCLDAMVKDTLMIGDSVITQDITLKTRVERVYSHGKMLIASDKFPGVTQMLKDYGIKLGYWYPRGTRAREESRLYMLPFFMAGLHSLYSSSSDYTNVAEFDDDVTTGFIRSAEALGMLYDFDEVSQSLYNGDEWPVSAKFEYNYQDKYFTEYPYLRKLAIDGLRYMNPLALEMFLREFSGDHILGLFCEPDVPRLDDGEGDEDIHLVDSVTAKAIEDAHSDTPSEDAAIFPVYTDEELSAMEAADIAKNSVQDEATD